MARLTSSIILFAFFIPFCLAKLHQVIFRDVVIFSCNAHGVCVFVCRTVQIGGECHVVGGVMCHVPFLSIRKEKFLMWSSTLPPMILNTVLR